jgi:hypothetical protein
MELTGFAKVSVGQSLPIRPDDCEIGGRVSTDDCCLKGGAVNQPHPDPVNAPDDMVVCQDVPVRSDNHSRTCARAPGSPPVQPAGS